MSSRAAGLGSFQKDQLPKVGGEPGLWASSWPKPALRMNPLRLPGPFLEVQGRTLGPPVLPSRTQMVSLGGGAQVAACERGIYKDVVGQRSHGDRTIPTDGDCGMF